MQEWAAKKCQWIETVTKVNVSKRWKEVSRANLLSMEFCKQGCKLYYYTLCLVGVSESLFIGHNQLSMGAGCVSHFCMTKSRVYVGGEVPGRWSVWWMVTWWVVQKTCQLDHINCLAIIESRARNRLQGALISLCNQPTWATSRDQGQAPYKLTCSVAVTGRTVVRDEAFIFI